MPGRERVPSFQIASGTTVERDGSYNLTTVGSIFYNTDTSNVEIRHEGLNNNTYWSDLVSRRQFKFHQQTARSTSAQQVIGNANGANPPDSDMNYFGGALTNFVITGIEGRHNGVRITWEITGEWDVNPYDKGLIVYKEKVNSLGVVVDKGFLRADAGQSKQVRWVSPFTNAHQTDTNSTMDTTSGTFIDTDIVADFTYKYTPVLVNSGTSNSNFYLNGTKVNSNAPAAELACSVFAVQEF